MMMMPVKKIYAPHKSNAFAWIILMCACFACNDALANPCLPITPGDSVEYGTEGKAMLVKGLQGTPILAVDNGTIEEIIPETNCVVIQHQSGLMTYCNVNARLSNIVPKAIVQKGQILGSLGTSASVTLEGDPDVLAEIKKSRETCACVPNCAA